MTANFQLTKAESKLAELLWRQAPIASGRLVELAKAELGWHKSTTFTNLRMLIKKGLAKNESATVRMLFTREQFRGEQSASFVDETFGGSLPLFLTAFSHSRQLSADQVQEIRRLIAEYVEDEQTGGFADD